MQRLKCQYFIRNILFHSNGYYSITYRLEIAPVTNTKFLEMYKARRNYHFDMNVFIPVYKVMR
jgi:hypothetical protein